MRVSKVIPDIVENAVKFFGWSPIGKAVRLRIEGGKTANLIGSTIEGKILSLRSDGAAVIDTGGGKIDVKPRHLGYGFFYLRMGRIGVYLIDESTCGSIIESDPRIAEGILSLR